MERFTSLSPGSLTSRTSSNLPSESRCVSVKGCSQNGKNDPTLFALAVIEPQKYLTKIVKVWKLDKPTGRILDYTSAGVKCVNHSQVALVSE